MSARFLFALLACLATTQAFAQEITPRQYLKDAEALYERGYFFRSARYAFAAADEDGGLQSEAYAWITLSLMRASQENGAAYFFIRTLQEGDKASVKRVLTVTDALIRHVGADLLRKYLIRHTKYEDYTPKNLGAYLYALGKDALLAGQEDKAVGYLSGMSRDSSLWPYALQLRATAYSLLGKLPLALDDFGSCVDRAEDIPIVRGRASEQEDLRARCQAGVARVLYEMGRFEDADRAYDMISKQSFVWPDILFEQAWNSYAQREYNRTLGRLVSYKSPALQFVFNSENDALRAQTYLGLCLYSDTNDTINDFNSRYGKLGEQIKHFVEGNAGNLDAFYDLGRKALSDSLYTGNDLHKLANRFIRGPYFQNLAAQEREITLEQRSIAGLAPESVGQGFPGFMTEVLKWRLRSVKMLGGAYVKNSLIDYHKALLADFDKMSFIKFEMLNRAKDAILRKNVAHGDRDRGDVTPSRKDSQYFWSFNGEFWNDELGDYVFGLESECNKSNATSSVSFLRR